MLFSTGEEGRYVTHFSHSGSLSEKTGVKHVAFWSPVAVQNRSYWGFHVDDDKSFSWRRRQLFLTTSKKGLDCSDFDVDVKFCCLRRQQKPMWKWLMVENGGKRGAFVCASLKPFSHWGEFWRQREKFNLTPNCRVAIKKWCIPFLWRKKTQIKLTLSPMWKLLNVKKYIDEVDAVTYVKTATRDAASQ